MILSGCTLILCVYLSTPLVSHANIAAGTADTWTIQNNTSNNTKDKIDIGLPPKFLGIKADWITPEGQKSDFYSLSDPIKLSSQGDYKLTAQDSFSGTDSIIERATIDCRFIKDNMCNILTIPTYSNKSGQHTLSIEPDCTVKFDNIIINADSRVIDSDLSQCD